MKRKAVPQHREPLSMSNLFTCSNGPVSVFNKHFANFQLKIKETSEKQNMRIYSKVEFDEEVSSGSEISTQMFHKEFLNEIFQRRIFSSKLFSKTFKFLLV
jgi:hypothetical protein